MLLIKDGKIITMNDKNYEVASVLIDNGKIIEVGENVEINDAVKIIDAKGCWVLPGLIDAHCHIGIMEEKIGVEGRDVNEATDPITPHMRAIDGINPLDSSFFDARKAGVTAVMTGPGSTNVIGGQFVVMKTSGNCIDDMVVREPAAMKISFGENPKKIYNGKNRTPMTRMGIAALLRDTLIKAKNYQIRKINAFNKNENFEIDIKMEAMLPVLNKEIPLKAHVHRADDILTAIRIAREFDLDITLDHCTEGDLIIDKLKESKAPIILGPIMTTKSKVEVRNKSIYAPNTLNNAGIKIAIITDHPVTPIGYLPICAALAVKGGLDMKDALKAITINAAEILGVSDRMGSIEKFKDADIAIFDGNPLDMYTNTVFTIIDGNIVYNKYEELVK